MALTIWKSKTDVQEKTNCSACGYELTIYCTPFLKCPNCMIKIEPDLRDITNKINDRCKFYGIKGQTID